MSMINYNHEERESNKPQEGKSMTKKEAINICISYLFDHIQAGDFWNDPAYEEEIKALVKLGVNTKRAAGDKGDAALIPALRKS